MIKPATHTTSRLRIIVLGYIVRGPLGGMAWSDLHYLLGLVSLGHEVYFLEDSDDYPCCYDPIRGVTDTDPTYGLKFASRIFARFGLSHAWAYHDAHTSRWYGACADYILEMCQRADILLNLSGVNPMRPWLREIPVRILVEKDPVFTQIRHLSDPTALALAKQHTAFFSFGENINSGATIPNDGLPWIPTRHPIFLDAWAVTPAPKFGKYTTVMLWDSYPAREYQGIRYGMKSDSFAPYIDLPAKVGNLELAVGSPTAPRALLNSKGWTVRDPYEVTRDLETYQQYIQQSYAEFSVAKHGYVISRSGWFSERSASYLATGRPVLLQETGFSDWLPTGAGVISFSTPEAALTGITEINSRYEFHSQSARAIACEYFDARKVLRKLLADAMHPDSVSNPKNILSEF